MGERARIRFLAVFALLSICLVLSAGIGLAEVKYSGTLKVENDTVNYKIGEYTGSILFSEFRSFDSINFELSADVYLTTASDTVVLSPDTTPRYINMLSGELSKGLTILYFNKSKKQSADKLKLLKEYPAFSDKAEDFDFEFTYSTRDDEHLSEFRDTFNLDSIAGRGDEISKIINLLNWSNKIVLHDGSVDPANPNPKNAMNIIATCQRENKGVNCRMLATLLNEAYLATGFKSRHVTCLPYDKQDADCHVINMVFCQSLGKWLYVDPTFAAYFMDGDSTMLSIEEVRQKLIAGEELLIPDQINWNGAPKDKNQYKNYMTKNLFRFSCPLKSELGYESKKERAWVYLNPAGYDSELSGTADTTKRARNTFVKYYTSDSQRFWAKPE